jgi:ATP-binding cassette subfamily D (ALD) protein 2
MAAMAKVYKKLVYIYHGLRFMYENQSKFRKFLLKTGAYGLLIALLVKLAKKLGFARRKALSVKKPNASSGPSTGPMSQPNPSVNKQFLSELAYLLKVMFPRFFSKQTFLLGLHTFTLICRTFLSIYVAKLEGQLVRNIVEKNFLSFARKLGHWLLIALPATTCNSLIRYLESKLDIELKTQLIRKSHKFYFENRVYYKIAIKQSENTQVDQNLTEDIDKLVQLLVHLYSHLTKPLLDITLISATLISLAKSKSFDYKWPSSIALIIVSLTSTLIRSLSPRFGKMAADIAKQKGYLRFLYTRIQTNSEEIAFYAGEKVESNLIEKNYTILKKQLEIVYVKKFWYIILEQFLLKYVWSAGK